MNDGAMRSTVLHFSCNHQSVMPDTMAYDNITRILRPV